MPRLALIVNPKAVRVTRRRADVVWRMLALRYKVDREETTARGHAATLAGDAVADGADAVVVMGGDGTVAEVLPALAGGEVPLGVIPGGGTNVLARTLGISETPRKAAAQLYRALGLGPRRVGLGRAEVDGGGPGRSHLFGFVAGVGFDAATVRLVERRRRWKRSLGDVLYAASAVEAFIRYDRRHPALSIGLSDGTSVEGIHHLMVANSSPYTFMGPLPLILTPDAHLNRPLAVAAFRRMTLGFTLRML